jgi:sugar phosphate isomerase/epimerase
VTTPQESSEPRIVPFRPRQGHLTPAVQGEEARAAAGDEDGVDRLLAISTIDDPLPGELEGVHHLRSVQLGASSGAFFPHTPTELTPRAAGRLGISTIEIMLQTAGEYGPQFARLIAANAQAAGVSIASVHTMSHLHPLLSPYPRRVLEGRALFQEAIELAVTVGAGVLVWHGPNRREVETDEGWERFIEIAAELARACGEAGITLGIENVSHGALALVRHVVNFATRLGEVGSQRQIGFVFDPFQAVEAGANPFMMLAAMGNRVVNVHISDYREQDPGARHLLPGDGDLPWSALVRAIAGSGYTGPMMIEGPLGADAGGMKRVRHTLEPLMRSVFSFEPDARRHEAADDDATMLVAPPLGVLKGIDLFNRREFYEQHEEIEAEWHAERGPIRRLYQGLLQIGIGFHHTLNGNERGAVALLTDGIAKTSDFLPQALGIDTAGLVCETQACLDRILELGPEGIARFDRDAIPTIRLIAD